MAWTAPYTYTTGELVTASMLNADIRDNLLQTAPAKVTTAGDIVYATAASALARLGIGGANTLLHGGASAPAWSAVATADIANDAVDDTKVGNRVPRLDNRQGGNATSWTVAGTSSYSPAQVQMQGGTIQWTGGAAVSGNVAITFPVEFIQAPILLACARAAKATAVGVVITGTTGATFYWENVDGSTDTLVDIHWLAVGGG